jgi:hypothetical protein
MYTLQGKTRPTWHVRFPRQSTYASYGRSPYVATFRESPTDLDRSHCSREKGLLTQSTARRLTDPWVRTQLLSWTSQWSRGVSQAPDDDQLLGLPGPYHRHAIDTFNTCSWGPTERSLTDPGGGYKLGCAGLSHTHSLTFPTSCLPFSLVAPPGLQLHQDPLLKPQCWVLENLWPSRGLLTTRPSTIAYIYV